MNKFAAARQAGRIAAMLPLRFRPLWLSLAWTLVALVSVLSLLPHQDLPDIQYNDKLEHATAYFALMALFGQLYGPRLKPVFLLLAFGASIEVLQGLSGYRDMSFLDWLADAFGIAVGWLLARYRPRLLADIEAQLP